MCVCVSEGVARSCCYQYNKPKTKYYKALPHYHHNGYLNLLFQDCLTQFNRYPNFFILRLRFAAQCLAHAALLNETDIFECEILSKVRHLSTGSVPFYTTWLHQRSLTSQPIVSLVYVLGDYTSFSYITIE